MSGVLLAGLWLGAVSAFGALFSGGEWTVPVVLAVLAPLGIEAANSRLAATRPSRARLVVRLVTLGAQVYGCFALLGWASYPHTMLLGVLPTPATVTAVAHGLSEGLVSSRATVPPTQATAAFVTLAAGAAWWCAAASSACLWTAASPGLAVAPPVALYAGVKALADGRPGGAPVALVVALAVATVASSRLTRSRPVRPQTVAAAGALAVLVAAGTLVAPFAPGWGAGPVVRWRKKVTPNISVSPDVDVRPQLRRSEPVEVFRVQVQTRNPTYWRLTALDVFDGRRWTMSAQPPALPGPSGGIRTLRLRQQVKITALRSEWLPAAFAPVAASRDVAYDPAVGALRTSRPRKGGWIYGVESAVASPGPEELAKVGPATRGGASRRELAHYTTLPPLPKDVTAWVRRAAGGARSPFEAAISVQNTLRDFEYDLDVPAGAGGNDLARFLTETRRGYCEQFAAAMAVAARSLGIPARVAIGYTPGKANVTEELFTVTTAEAHAWPELWFDGYGWLAFEPTPSRSNPTAGYAAPPASGPGSDPTAAATPEASAPAPVPGATSSPTPAASPTPPASLPGVSPSPTPEAGRPPVWLFLVVFAALVVLTPVLWKLVRRRRRLRTGPPGAWAAARDLAVDLGVDPGAADTPAEFAERAASGGIPLDDLAGLHARSRYGPTGRPRAQGTRAWEMERQVRRRLWRQEPFRVLRAGLSWRSLGRGAGSTRVSRRSGGGDDRSSTRAAIRGGPPGGGR